MSPLQQVDLISLHRLFVAEQRDEDAQPDRGLGYGVGNNEDREDLAADVVQILRKSDQIDVDRVQDQLDRHQDDHNIAAGQHPNGPDQQERGAQSQIVDSSNWLHASDPLLRHHYRSHNGYQQQDRSDLERQQVLGKQRVGDD